MSNARRFYSKQTKNLEGSLYLTGNQLSRNVMFCVVDNHNYMYHIFEIGFLDYNFN